jgi:hypothetical protein
MAELEDQFEIFSGEVGRGPLWISTAMGLVTAKQRMRDLAACYPGAYFIYSVSLRSVVASVKTGSNSKVRVTSSEYSCDDALGRPAI